MKILSMEDGFIMGEQWGFIGMRKPKPAERMLLVDTSVVWHPGTPCPIGKDNSPFFKYFLIILFK